MDLRTSFASRFSGLGRLALAGAFVVGAALAPLAASAHLEGGSWPYDRSTDAMVLHYDNNCLPVSDWMSMVDLAAANWTRTPTVIWLLKAPSNCTEWSQNLDVLGGWDDNPGKLAWTSNWERDCFIFCWWDVAFEDTFAHSTIRVNENNANNFGFGGLDELGQLEAITHEMGHTLGLGHTGYYAGEHPLGPWFSFPIGSYSVMDYCCDQSIDHPLQHDINDLNGLYPF